MAIEMYVVAGAAIAMSLGGAGSAMGLRKSGEMVTGILREKPDRWASLFMLAILPSTQGLYGFITAMMALLMSQDVGIAIMIACIPAGITGLITGPMQGSVCAAASQMVAARPDQRGRGILLAVFIEFYAVLGLIVSIMALIL